MRSKLALSALVAASLFGATTIASAQTQPAPGASSDSTAAPTCTKMKTKKMSSDKMKSGSTTGMSKAKPSKGDAGADTNGNDKQ